MIPDPRASRRQLIDWLVKWREDHKGSRSPENNRANLNTWTTEDLRRRVRQIKEHEKAKQND